MSAEDVLVMPDAWRRLVQPRRDRPAADRAPATRPAPEKAVLEKAVPEKAAAEEARALIEDARADVEEVLSLPGTDPLLAGRARAYLRGEADPLGAAVVTQVVVGKRKQPVAFGDLWALDHGLPFAASACVEMFEIISDFRVAGRQETWTGVRVRRPGDRYGQWWVAERMALRLRALLAAADDAVYDAAVDRLAPSRRTPLHKMVASYLVPTQTDWVDDVCAAPPTVVPEEVSLRWMFFCSLGAPHQPALAGLPLDYYGRGEHVIATLVEGIGPEAVVPLVAQALDDEYLDADTARRLLDTLVELPVDAAFQALADRLGRRYVPAAAIRAARRYPARALRLLAGAADAPGAAELLSAHLLTHPDLVDAMLPVLPEKARAAIGAVRESSVRLPDADALPAPLVDPPWTRPRAKTKPVVIKGLTPPGTRSVHWAPGEREEWTVDLHHRWRWAEKLSWHQQVKKFEAGDLPAASQPMLFLEAPEELVRPLLPGWKPPHVGHVHEWMPVVVARFGPDALDAALDVASRDPARLGWILLPYLSDEVAWCMADWHARLKQAGRAARAWFDRHGTAAVPMLAPAALGRAGAGR
ncbi:hypothetical protein, partial [Actinomadura roseirufa]|uniref:hypothetical protein n=1 Tax=Actinomadura roseirufa TaxID=2094049 RepID=UPI001A9548C1